MAIDRSAEPFNPDEIDMGQALEIVIEDPESVSIMDEDGGMLIDFDPQMETPEMEHGGNLAEVMDDRDLDELSSELIGQFESDRLRRS